MVDLHQSFFRVHVGDGDILVTKQGGEAASLGLLQEVVHGGPGGGGVELEDLLEEPWVEGGVSEGRVFDGEDGGVLRREEEWRRASEEVGHDGEPSSSESVGGIHREVLADEDGFLVGVLGNGVYR